MRIPGDPAMAVSMLNTALRDRYGDLDELCRAEDIDRASLEKKLEEAGFAYREDIRQFR